MAEEGHGPALLSMEANGGFGSNLPVPSWGREGLEIGAFQPVMAAAK
jgi:hypothetical protein